MKAQGSRPGHAGVALGGGSDFHVGCDHSYNLPGAWVLAAFGGEFVDPNDQTRCDLGRSGSIRCGERFYDLLNSGVGAGTSSGFFSGQTVSFGPDSQGLIRLPGQLRGVKWDFFNLPVWPVVPTTYGSTDSLGNWAGTKHVDAAWTLLKCFSHEAAWQRLQMRALLFTPSRRDLVDEWIAVVRQVAPPLRSKNLDLFIAKAQANQQGVGRLFRYNSGAAQSILCWLALLLVRVIEEKTGRSWGSVRQRCEQMSPLEFRGPDGQAAQRTATTTAQRQTHAALGLDEPPLMLELVPGPTRRP